MPINSYHNRCYLRTEKIPPHGQAHLVLAIAQRLHRKPKELDLPHQSLKRNDNFNAHLMR